MLRQLLALLGLCLNDVLDLNPSLGIYSMVLMHELYAQGQLVYGLFLFFSLGSQELPQDFGLDGLSASLSPERAGFS